MSNVLTKNLVLSQPKAGQGGESTITTLHHTSASTETHTIVKVEIPGVDPSTVEVNFEGNILHISCEKGEASLPIGPTVDSSKIEAEILWGVLTLRIPIPKPPAARSISIKTLDTPKKTTTRHREEEFTAVE
jgi:HSP20 family molecular chaperone IbpA